MTNSYINTRVAEYKKHLRTTVDILRELDIDKDYSYTLSMARAMVDFLIVLQEYEFLARGKNDEEDRR